MSVVAVQPCSIADMFPKGTVIWRGGIGFQRNRFGGFTPQISDMRFQRAPRGGFVGRVVLGGGSFFAEPVLFPSRIGQHRISGIVAFFDFIPRRWTHFIVIGHTKAAREPGTSNEGAALFLRGGVTKLPLEEYARFRTEIAEEYRNHFHDDLETVYQIHAKHSVPITYKHELKRLIHVKSLDEHGKNEWSYAFRSVEQELS